MKIILNNEEIITASCTLLDVLSERSLHKKTGIAVALNQTVIQKSNWETTKVQTNDSIMIITATQGG
ncbi:MAG: sulfur carrier protein ThiS [Flavobacteriales bacterium]|nr:sulfur carrier protein ThiS [Flavobacteriales bacterium]